MYNYCRIFFSCYREQKTRNGSFLQACHGKQTGEVGEILPSKLSSGVFLSIIASVPLRHKLATLWSNAVCLSQQLRPAGLIRYLTTPKLQFDMKKRLLPEVHHRFPS